MTRQHQKHPLAKSSTQSALLWSLFTSRPQNQYHRYLKPASLRRLTQHSHRHRAHEHHHRQVFYNAVVKLPNGDIQVYQLPKDLTNIIHHEIRYHQHDDIKFDPDDYFDRALIVVPTTPYPNPRLRVGQIQLVEPTHHYSKNRTRSQFIRDGNYDDVKFLMHNYDPDTQNQIKQDVKYFQDQHQHRETLEAIALIIASVIGLGIMYFLHGMPIIV